MMGSDADFEITDPAIHSPIQFEKQSERKPFNKFGVFGPQILNENRFINNDKDLTTVCSKYLDYHSPDFGKWADHSLDEFIKNESSCANDNVNNIMYDPKFELTERNMMKGIPNFHRFTKRQVNKVKHMQILTSVDPDRLAIGKDSTLKQSPDRDGCPFKNLMSRDKIYERMHGLPLMTKEETIKKKQKD